MFNWLFLNESSFSEAEQALWKASALRIILVSGFFLEASIGLHSSFTAMQIGAYHIVVLVALFCMALCAGMVLSTRRPHFASGILLATVYAAGTSIVYFVDANEIAKLGIIFFYTTPTIARLFFSTRLAVLLMALNFLPFFYLLRNGPFVHFQGLNITLAASHSYIQGLLFLFFNVCVPLAVFRVLHALDASAIRHRATSSALATSHAQYREFFENAGGPILLCDANGRMLQANRMAGELIGLDAEPGGDELIFNLLRSCRTEALARGELAAIDKLEAVQGQYFNSLDGRRVVVEFVTKTEQNYYIAVLRDTSRLREIEEALQRSRDRETFLRLNDAQTQLPNREALLRHLSDTLERNDANGVMALASFRLNSVRYANEKYGANVGDVLIRRFADDLRATLPPGTYCARLRSLIFSVVLGPVQSSIELVQQVEKLRNSLPHECDFDGNSLPIQLSTGIALIRAGETSAEVIMRRSEVALDSARRSSENPVALFDEIDEAQIRRAIEIEHGIMAALKNKEFRLVYQPKVDKDGKIAGLEALIRWRSPVLGPISPAEFIPIAEACGLIHEITSFVIESSCSFIRNTINRGYICPPVALNLSAIDIVRHDLLELIHTSTNRYGTPPDLLEFEITETALIGNEALAIQHMQELQRRGSSIAIDDFGTGYSSLLKLSSFPVQSIKIDQSFVARIGTSAKSESIIKAIVSLAEILSCTSIAEGVEHPEQEAFLVSVGCKLFQGFYYHRPMEVVQLEAILLKDASMATLA
jgi:diguanylate cyclase (GGDEF)-like protein/PAS domain S-box-containing protein